MRRCQILGVILLILIATLFSFKATTFPVYITGHLRKNPNDTSVRIKRDTIIAKGGNKNLTKPMTSLKGNFKMLFTPTNEKSFGFFCTAKGTDTVLIASVKGFDTDEMKITFYLPVKYKKNIQSIYSF